MEWRSRSRGSASSSTAQPSMAATRSGPRSPATSSGTAVATSGAPAPARSTMQARRGRGVERCRRAVDCLVLTRGGDESPAPALRGSGRPNLVEARRRCPPTRREAGRSMHMRQVRGQPPASVAGVVVVRQRPAAGDCELRPSSATSICTMSGAIRAAIAKGSRASAGVMPSTAMARTPTGTRSSGAI